MKRPKILCVCDRVNVASGIKSGDLFKRALIFSALSNEQASDYLNCWEFAVIILDVDTQQTPGDQRFDYRAILDDLEARNFQGLIVAGGGTIEKRDKLFQQLGVLGYDYEVIKSKIEDGTLFRNILAPT
ncbi:MAG: hypothetical protein BWY51_00294 [Parcubacteria group bacterium ADurb.Bin316]|nr:MAG: hypothetical protein BWY51_00294 [Parcubacteria group bacterium ADurb.Bin316]HOZ56052.1 hypothetical protein [bacterium]